MSEYPARPTHFGRAKMPAIFLARVLGWNGALVTQAVVSAASYQVHDMDDGGREIAHGDLVVADSIYDTPQEGPIWPSESGYNLAAELPAACFPVGGRLYRVEVHLTDGSGRVSVETWDYWAEDVLGL